MSREWQPGDVAMVGASVALRTQNGFVDPENHCWRNEDETARPLVVIDPEDREQIERLRDAITAQMYAEDYVTTGDVEAALREFANPTPPKPDEPTGLGAVVEAQNGDRWVRLHAGANAGAWVCEADDTAEPHLCEGVYLWSDFAAVKVLSEGIS